MAAIATHVNARATNWTFRLVLVAYVALGLADVLTTQYGLAHGGQERNPIAAALYAQFGIASLYVFKVLIVAVILVGLRLMPRRIAVWVGTAFAAVTALAVIGNLQVIAPVQNFAPVFHIHYAALQTGSWF